MGRYRNLAVAVLAGIVVMVVLVLVTRGGQRPGGPPVAASVQAAWNTFAAEVTGVRKVDDRTVMVQVSLPAGRDDCAREPRIEMLQDQLTDRPDTIYANVVFASAGSQVAGACPDSQPVEVEMRVAQPLGQRVLVFNSDARAWAPVGDIYQQCDPTLGCEPPVDHCDPAWIDQAVLQMDVPVKRVRSVRDVLACDGTWLVFDLNRAIGECPPAEGGAKCEVNEKATRVFLHFDTAWVTVAGTQEGGCRAVHAEQPAFPAAMCENLPPTG